MLLRIENYARIFEQITEPVDYYATVWCENMADRSAIQAISDRRLADRLLSNIRRIRKLVM